MIGRVNGFVRCKLDFYIKITQVITYPVTKENKVIFLVCTRPVIGQFENVLENKILWIKSKFNCKFQA